MTDIKLQSVSVTDSQGHRYVEVVYADHENLDDAEQHLIFRIETTSGRSPRVPEAQLEALRNVRNVVSAEIQRLEEIRGREFRNEDW